MISKIHSLVIGVNYNSDESALEFVRSLKEISSPQNVTIILVDNTDREDSSEFFDRVWNVCSEVRCIKSPRNLGYFGGAHFGLTEYLKNSDYPDWVIVSNVDIEFLDNAFFFHLGNTSNVEDIGIIATSIWSEDNHSDWNPKIRSRPSKMRMHFYKVLYRSYYMYNIYLLLSTFRSFVRHMLGKNTKYSEINAEQKGNRSKQDIYAPHGAFIIFSKLYFNRGGTLDYPVFLYGEEIFVAETARQLGLRVIYEPKLRVCSYDHIATGQFPRSHHIASYHRDSTAFIADTYFK